MTASVFNLFTIFEKSDANGGPQPGDVYWVPAAEVPEVPMILDVERSDPTEHEVTSFAFRELDPKLHFRERERLPIKKLNLDSTHELLLTRAKMRRCIVLFGAAIGATELKGMTNQQQRRAQHLTRKSYVVVPAFGIGTPNEPNGFSAELVERTLALRYPHWFCIPDFQGQEPRSILRLERMFSTALGRGSRHAGFRMADEPLQLLLAQVAILAGHPVPGFFAEVQSILNS